MRGFLLVFFHGSSLHGAQISRLKDLKVFFVLVKLFNLSMNPHCRLQQGSKLFLKITTNGMVQ